MSGVICAIRGGPDSKPTIEAAIELAKETGTVLHFLYVVNLNFLVRTSSSRTHVVSKELHQMGEFILLSAQSVAQKQSVSAEIAVRHGNVGDEIIAFANEIEAGYVVLGRPRGAEDTVNAFGHDNLRRFAARIEAESSARVIFAETMGANR